MSDWSKLLIGQGDPVEKEGCEKYLLHEKFPRYAEIWGRYVWPNRDRARNDLSKLREGFPVKLEKLFNHHYGVWFHFTIACRQIEALRQDNKFVDVSDPLFHLATAIDLIESTFVIALEIQYGLHGQKLIKKFTQRKFEKHVRHFWKKEYPRGFRNWGERHKPVEIPLHRTKILFDEYIGKHIRRDVRKEFNHVSNESIRRYRNVLAHNLSPLRTIDKETGKIRIPKEQFLAKYSSALWSSDRFKYDPEHYELAEIVIGNLGEDLVRCTNELWEALLEMIKEIISSENYKAWFPPQVAGLYGESFNVGVEVDLNVGEESGEYTSLQIPAADNFIVYHGGTITQYDIKPSAYHDDKSG